MLTLVTKIHRKYKGERFALPKSRGGIDDFYVVRKVSEGQGGEGGAGEQGNGRRDGKGGKLGTIREHVQIT